MTKSNGSCRKRLGSDDSGDRVETRSPEMRKEAPRCGMGRCEAAQSLTVQSPRSTTSNSRSSAPVDTGSLPVDSCEDLRLAFQFSKSSFVAHWV